MGASRILENEAGKTWLKERFKRLNRAVKDRLIVCIEGLKDFSWVIQSVHSALDKGYQETSVICRL